MTSGLPGHTIVDGNVVDETGKRKNRLRNDTYIIDKREEGDDYCWECGHVAPQEAFLEHNRCPSPDCPRPGMWDD